MYFLRGLTDDLYNDFFNRCGFGFCGTCLSGLILTFLMGLSVGSVGLMLSGLAMGVFYWLGGQLEKLYALGKQGWNWGEWLFGAYLGGMLVLWLG